jgi:hypothetical protein
MTEHSARKYYPALSGIGAGILYGLAARLLFSSTWNQGPNMTLWGIMTFGFIFIVPFALGFLTVYIAELDKKRSWWFRIFMPWAPGMFLLLLAGAVGWEGSICLLMALPIFLIMSSLGGVISAVVIKSSQARTENYSIIVFILVLPYVSAPIESGYAAEQSVREVKTSIVIAADRETVWRNIERVPRIREDEQRLSLFHLIGFPRPVEATLSHEAAGAVRHATFEGGVLFIETIRGWKPGEELAFSIKADTASIAPTTLDEHVTIGGPYFDVLEGRYRIEQMSGGEIMLRLSSTHRLSTRFNFYSGLWTDFIMRDIQQNILRIIKDRCEARQPGDGG